jgi:hypothetical protein
MGLTAEERQQCRARAATVVRELGAIARKLTQLSVRADQTSARGDTDAMLDVAEALVELHAQFDAKFQELLIVYIREPRPPAQDAVVLPLPGPDRMSC